ncbi:MAG TPA: DUF2188 domain-containing protein [Steroidobacteraceae bacterium]|nr:DUF2188 domain-containing protein [Steroidobacteraceae bacterium]
MTEAPALDRAALYRVLDRYLAALRARDAARVRWAPRAVHVENNVVLVPGDGLWGTVTALGDYELRFADTRTGEVGFFGAVTETRDTSPFGLRLKVDAQGAILEAEVIIVRAADSGLRFPEPRFENKPALNAILPEGSRTSRARMRALANGYFDTLQLNDGTLHTQFWDSCNRVENGVQTTNNPDLALLPSARLGCAEQFRLGVYRYDDRLRARRFPLIDVERGLVLAAGFIDHCGRLGSYSLTDGRTVESPIRRPHSFYLLELFRIRDEKLEQIEAVFITVPYHMPSPFEQNEDRTMSKIIYHLVQHDGGWAYRVDETFSETFPSYESARQAAERAAREQALPGEATVISYEDKQGHWHQERVAGNDRPEPEVEG